MCLMVMKMMMLILLMVVEFDSLLIQIRKRLWVIL